MSSQDQTTVGQGTGVDDRLQTANILDTARQIAEISRFVEAMELCGSGVELEVPELHTLFAPDNQALDAVPNHFWAELQKPENRERLLQVVRMHVVRGRQTEADLRTTPTVKSLDGEPVEVEFRPEGSRFGGAALIRRDIPCTNGMIHVIDKLLVREYSYSG